MQEITLTKEDAASIIEMADFCLGEGVMPDINALIANILNAYPELKNDCFHLEVNQCTSS